MRLAPHRLTPSSPDKIYRIVTMVNTLSRDRAPLETVGVYDPTPRAVPVVPASRRSLLDEGKQPETSWVKRIEWDRERVQHWLSHGAQPTKRVAWLLQKVSKLACEFYNVRVLMRRARWQEKLSMSTERRSAKKYMKIDQDYRCSTAWQDISWLQWTRAHCGRAEGQGRCESQTGTKGRQRGSEGCQTTVFA